MKKVLMLLVILVAALASAAFCAEQDDLYRNSILTEGAAKVTAPNDSASIIISIVTDNPNLAKATQENTAKANRIMDALKALKIAGIKIQTQGFTIIPQKDYKTRPQKILGYEVRNSVEVKLEGLTQEELSNNVSKIIDAAIKSGSNEISSLMFYIKDEDALQNQALQQATKKAITKAKALAEASGVQLKRIILLSSRPLSQGPLMKRRMVNAGLAAEDAMATPIEAGEGEITATVNLVYEIE